MPTLPPRDPTVQTLQKQIADLRRELRLMQEKPHADDLPRQRRTEVIFSYHGEVVSDDPSGRYLLKDFSATIHRLDITAGFAGFEDSTYQVLIDGVVVYEGTLDALETMQETSDLAIEIEEYSTLSVNWPVVGDSLSTVVMTFQIIAVEGEEYD